MDNQQFKPEISKIIRNLLKNGHYKVFLFGSRAAGQASERSDFDIGLEAEKPIPLATLGAIKEEIEKIPTLNKFDVVDFKTVSADFRKVALENVEVIYEQ